MAERGRRKVLVGKVVSDKMTKTRVVRVHRLMKHPKYGKIIRKWSQFSVHDENNDSLMGDEVKIVETRPLSKTKRWRLVEIVTKAKSADVVQA